MTKLRMKTNFIMIMVLSLLLVGSIGSITKNIELQEKDLDNLQDQSLEALFIMTPLFSGKQHFTTL